MITLDSEKQKQAKEYARIRRRLWLVDTGFSTLYFSAWLFFGWSISLRQSLTLLTDNWLLITAFYIAIFGGVYFLLNLPLGYYSGFVLPHRFDQSNQNLKDWIMDQLKGIALGAPLGLILLELLYLALRVTGDLWWLWAAGGLLVFNVLLINLAPILIMPLFNKYVPLDDEHKELADRLLKLAERAKQYGGLDDFMNVKQQAVTNAANLAFFMVNFSSVLLRRFRESNPEFGILDLKSHYRGCRYVSETIKLLPQKPDGILLARFLSKLLVWVWFIPFLNRFLPLNWRWYCPL